MRTDLRRTFIEVEDLRKGSILSAREWRRFFRFVENMVFLRGLVTSTASLSTTGELRDDAREDWRESDAIESRRAGGRMSANKFPWLSAIGERQASIGVISGISGERLACSTLMRLSKLPLDSTRKVGPLRGRGVRGLSPAGCSRDGRVAGMIDIWGAWNGSRETSGTVTILSLSMEGRGLNVVDVPNELDFLCTIPPSLSVVPDSTLSALLPLSPASSLSLL